MRVSPIDYAIIATYFVVVLGIGFVLQRRMRRSTDFLLAGRSIPAWAAGIAFIPWFPLGAGKALSSMASASRRAPPEACRR